MYTLGTHSCPCCGAISSAGLSTNPASVYQCDTCATPLAISTTQSISASSLFTPEALRLAQEAVHRRLQKSEAQWRSAAGAVKVDNRVMEEAFCEVCGKHTQCLSYARQTRSADEGQTIFYQCTICKTEWQQNS